MTNAPGSYGRSNSGRYKSCVRWQWTLCVMAVMVALFCAGLSIYWALFAISTGFQDSMGAPRNSDFAGHVRVYCVAAAPMLITALIAYGAARLRPKRRK